MMASPRRRKRPDLVRRSLLDRAAELARDQGLAAVTVQAVSEAAGVTKGGLFHHFPSKQALVEAVFADLLERVDEGIDEAMAEDRHRYGAFTRAYVEATLSDPLLPLGSRWAALHVSALAEPSARRLWVGWIVRRLERHADTDHGPALEAVRLAADGAWLAFLFHGEGGPVPDVAALRERLLAMTREVR